MTLKKVICDNIKQYSKNSTIDFINTESRDDKITPYKILTKDKKYYEKYQLRFRVKTCGLIPGNFFEKPDPSVAKFAKAPAPIIPWG